MDTSLEGVAVRLRQVMDERSITQIELGQIAGVTQGAVWRWLIGAKPSGSTPTKARIKRIAIHLDLNETWLLTGEGQKDLPLAERLLTSEAKAKQTEEAQKFVADVEGKSRVIYIQEHPHKAGQTLEFEGASDEDWAIVTKFIQEHWRKVKSRQSPLIRPMNGTEERPLG